VVTYSYATTSPLDTDRPVSVSASGLGTVVGAVSYHPDGPAGWQWGGLALRTRTVTKNARGEITGIEDRGPQPWNTLSYQYDGDGDLTFERDIGPGSSWLRALGTPSIGSPHVRTYGYATNKDVLSSWQDDTVAESVAYFGSGRRSTELQGTTSYTYLWSSTSPERLLTKSASGVQAGEVNLIYSSAGADAAGRVVGIDWSNNGSVDVTLGYGPLGQVTSRTTSSGTSQDRYDHDMRLVKTTTPSGSTSRFRYAFGRFPLQEDYPSSRYENIYLGEEPIGQIAVDATATKLRFLVTDRMGRVKKITHTNGTVVRRFVDDAWSHDNGNMVESGDHPLPNWLWGYPGQRFIGNGLVANGWRTYIPEIGQYSSPDPMHASSSSTFYGPQAYSYAAARPFMYTDPEGLFNTCEGPGGTLRPECMPEPMGPPAPTPTPTPPPTPAPAPPALSPGGGLLPWLCAVSGICLGPTPTPPVMPDDQECGKKRDPCQEQYDLLDIPTCRGLSDPGARARCYARAMERLVQCQRGGFVPPLFD
jgi:RHS repeat-associated protein